MHKPITYSQDHPNVSIDLTLTEARLVARTQGKGVLDKLRTNDLPLAALKHFCLAPTIAVQHVVGGTRTDTTYDYSYDSEFIFSFHEDGKLKTQRVFVNSQDERFQSLLKALQTRRPDASLLHLDSQEAQRQMGVISSKKAIFIIVGLIVGVPFIIALVALASAILG